MNIAFIGRMHSGKTTATKYFWKKSEKGGHIPQIIKFAQPLYATQKIFNPNCAEKNRLFLQKLGDLARECFHYFILNDLFVKNVETFQKKYSPPIDSTEGIEPDFLKKVDTSIYHKLTYRNLNIFCDDVRLSSELETVKSLNFITIGIKTKDKFRKSRNPELFINNDHVTERDIDSLIERCDYIIENNESIKIFEEKLEEAWRMYAYNWRRFN